MTKRSLSETEKQEYYDEEEEEDEEERKEGVVIRSSSSSSSSSYVDTNGFSSSLSSQTRLCCQVDCCYRDLGEAKRYHRRHKVCEHHAKAVVVSIDGIDQRFCQQCSRFHETSEFDDTKRSCRKRLAGHNERRRKISTELQEQEDAVCIASISDLKDKSWRVRGHLEHLTMRVRGKQSFKHFQIR